MILVNTDYISGKELDMLGLVKGSTIQTKNIGRDITQSFKTLVGGELKAYNEMMSEARALATKRMVEEAEALGADAIVNIRYASSAIMQGAADVIAEGTAREELYALYYEFGFSTAISEHRRTLSYVAQLADGVRLLALNCDGDGEGFTGFDAEQMEWILRQIADAKESGNFIFAMTHYPVLPGSPVMELIGDAKIDHWQKTADTLADAGLNLIFTGHMHMQSITKRVSQQGNPLYDICTGSFVGCPCAYRKVTFLPDGNVQIQSETIRDFDWEKGGRTAQEYFKWRFDRMITDILDAMADDFEFFMSRLGGAKPNQKLRLPVKLAGKLLQRLTLGGVGRLFFVHVDPSLRHVLLRDQAVELVRNIFVGNEPYVQGTPLYEAMDRLLCRLSPILHVVERKVGAGNPTLSDLHAFVLSLIGDENQIDDEAVLPIGWIKE